MAQRRGGRGRRHRGGELPDVTTGVPQRHRATGRACQLHRVDHDADRPARLIRAEAVVLGCHPPHLPVVPGNAGRVRKRGVHDGPHGVRRDHLEPDPCPAGARPSDGARATDRELDGVPGPQEELNAGRCSGCGDHHRNSRRTDRLQGLFGRNGHREVGANDGAVQVGDDSRDPHRCVRKAARCRRTRPSTAAMVWPSTRSIQGDVITAQAYAAPAAGRASRWVKVTIGRLLLNSWHVPSPRGRPRRARQGRSRTPSPTTSASTSSTAGSPTTPALAASTTGSVWTSGVAGTRPGAESSWNVRRAPRSAAASSNSAISCEGCSSSRTRPDSDALAALNLVLAPAPLIWQLSPATPATRLALAWRRPDWTAVMAATVTSYAQLLVSGGIDRIKVCANPDCSFMFYDETRNRSRRWCEASACGNLVRVRRHRAQRRR